MNKVYIIYAEQTGYKKHIHSLHEVNNRFTDYMLSLYHSTEDSNIHYTYELWQVRGEN